MGAWRRLLSAISSFGASLRDDTGAYRCDNPTSLYAGSLKVSATDYVHLVDDGDEPIPDLDRVLSPAPQLRFTIDYPFDRPYVGTITGDITLRRIIDAVRAAFDEMYRDATSDEIPGVVNREVTGAYGRAFHILDDLYIEGIDLCPDDMLWINIGS